VLKDLLSRWPVFRQIQTGANGNGAESWSERTRNLKPRRDRHPALRCAHPLVLENEHYFKEYVLHYTNSSTILREDYRDSEDGAGLFSGWDAEKKIYDPETWLYEKVDT
jgi:hypothetical protein